MYLLEIGHLVVAVDQVGFREGRGQVPGISMESLQGRLIGIYPQYR
jgi:hypothetical protein